MRTAFAQIVALAFLTVRYWRRGPLPTVRPRSGGRRSSAFVLRLVYVLLLGHTGHTFGHNCVAAGGDTLRSIQWLVLGLGGLSVAFGAMGSSAEVRGIRAPLTAPLLDSLPLHEASRVAVMVFQNVTAHVLSIASVAAASPTLGPGQAAGLGLALSTTGLLVGAAAARWLRIAMSPLRMARVAPLATALQMVSLLGIFVAPVLAHWAGGGSLVAFVSPVALAVLGGSEHGPGQAVAGLLVTAIVACLGIAGAERLGYDRGDAVPTRRIDAAPARELTLGNIERLLFAREPQRRLPWVAAAYSTLVTAGLAYLWLREPSLKQGPQARALLETAVGVLVFMAFTSASTRATRLAERDVLARSLLSPLPVLPSDVLRGKGSIVRRQTVLLVAPLAALVALPGPGPLRAEIAWRVVTIAVSLSCTADAAVSVAFLTTGLGDVRSRAAVGPSFGLEGMLLFLPLLTVATAPFVWSALVSVGCAALLAVEARTAALGCVRWQDDREMFDRETPVWRALLVFTAFQATQALALQILALSALPPDIATAVAYVASAAALLALTFYEQGGRMACALRPAGPPVVVAGLLGGLVSGAVAIGYGRLLASLGVAAPKVAFASDRYAMIVALILAAPIAEETFFRGWLQRAIHAQYDRRGRWFAVAVTAFAFAAIHPALSFVPVFVLGMVTGSLRASSGGITAGIVAHALHNGILMLLPPS